MSWEKTANLAASFSRLFIRLSVRAFRDYPSARPFAQTPRRIKGIAVVHSRLRRANIPPLAQNLARISEIVIIVICIIYDDDPTMCISPQGLLSKKTLDDVRLCHTVYSRRDDLRTQLGASVDWRDATK